MASLGGNAIHCATAAPSVGCPGRRSSRASVRTSPPTLFSGCGRRGSIPTGARPIPGPTVRNWVIYEGDGRRHWIYRTPPERRLEVAPGRRTSRTRGPRRRSTTCWSTSRPCRWPPPPRSSATCGPPPAATAGHLRITLDSHEAWDAGRDEILALARDVDVFVPSREELAVILGYDEPERGIAELIGDGVRAAVVKCGADGALAARERRASRHRRGGGRGDR